MSKIIIVTDSAAQAVTKAETMGLTRDDISIVTSLERMRGHKGMLMVYAGEPYTMDDFYAILDYAHNHDIKVLKWSSSADQQEAA